MKKVGFHFPAALFLAAFWAVCACLPSAAADSPDPGGSPRIYLCGEIHGSKEILEKELELWNGFYHTQNMRHLFLELPFYTAEYLNLWMQAEDDAILDALYEEWDGAAVHNPDYKAFLKGIKENCPDTVFHGTDLGHQFDTTGQRYLRFLQDSGMRDGDQYQRALDNAEQGAYFYATGDAAYRESKMAENLIREYEPLKGQPVMGIYGAAHIGLDTESREGAIPSMASQVQAYFGDGSVYTEDLSHLAAAPQAVRTDRITAGGREYAASYFGAQDLAGLSGYSSREFWRLEDAYDDFKGLEATGEVLPYDNYPMPVETGQVFLIEYARDDGSRERRFYRSDGTVWNGRPSTVGLQVP